MARASVHIGEINYAVSITAGRHQLGADEGEKLGGRDSGPAPYEILLSALGACTAITLRMYAERKAWPLRSVDVDLHYRREGETASITRVLRLEGALDDEQRARLADIAERTPVTLTLKGGVTIETRLG